MNGSGCKNLPVVPCETMNYRGSTCSAKRARLGLGDPMTNADRIRAMSDEDFAEYLIQYRDDWGEGVSYGQWKSGQPVAEITEAEEPKKKVCRWCGNSLEGLRSDAAFCRKECRDSAYRNRTREEQAWKKKAYRERKKLEAAGKEQAV